MEMPAGFCLPYAGLGVAVSCETRRDEPNSPRAETPLVEVRPSHSPEVDRRPPTGDKAKGKNKEKKVTYPVHSVRKRSAEDGPPYLRDKLEGSISTTLSSTSASDVELRLPPATPHSSTPVPGNQFAYPMSNEHETPAYEQPLSADLMPPPPSEYHVPFAAAQPARPFSADQGHHQGYSPVVMDPSQTNFPSSSPASYDTGSSGQSPASAGFGTNAAQGFMSRPEHYPTQVYPQSYEVTHHQPMSLHNDGMGGPPHVQYEDQKPYSIAPQYQPYDQNQSRGWDQSHGSQQQQQFWPPQSGYYQA